MTKQVKQGLFAFDGEAFHHHFQEQPDWDHITWFDNIGLPSAGPAYDALLRGKVTYDIDTDKITVGYYGTTISQMRVIRRSWTYSTSTNLKSTKKCSTSH